MNIGQAAKATELSAKMIRHYEKIGLLSATGRSVAGYRLYQDEDIATLRFIRQARQLGFSLDQIGELLALRQHQGKQRDAKQLASAHLEVIEGKMNELRVMQQSLQVLIANCPGEDSVDCPIIDGLQNPIH